MPVIFLTNEDSSESCFSQQFGELDACFKEIFHDTFSEERSISINRGIRF